MPKHDDLEIEEVGMLIAAALDGAHRAGWDDRALARGLLASTVAIFQEADRTDLASSLVRWIMDVDDFAFSYSRGKEVP